jgi:hypothetical protein
MQNERFTHFEETTSQRRCERFLDQVRMTPGIIVIPLEAEIASIPMEFSFEFDRVSLGV